MVRNARPEAGESYDCDVFISHASEDKARFAEPLIGELRGRGVTVWYDSEQIRLGDDFRRKMDEGLARARFGVVILTPRFFKYWPQAELSALFAQEAAFDATRILPVRGDIDRLTLIRQSPLLGGRAEIGWEMGVRAVAERVHERVRSGPASRVSARSRVYNLPPRRAQRLFGRKPDLERLEALLLPGRAVRIAASIEGLAGVGKTELALHLVDELAGTGRFPGGIFWLDAENPDLTLTWGTTIAEELAIAAETVEERAAGAVRSASSGAPVLVVLDNVERWTRESEPKPLPGGPQVALLVTTRHRFLGGPSFEHHTLEVLPEDAARELLLSVAGRDPDGAPGIEDLLRHLDGHSLAIELAGAYLHEFPAVTPAEYLRRLEAGAPVEEKVQDLVRHEATVRSALDVHWTQLEEGAREALLVAACFAPEDATTDLLESCGVSDEQQQPLRRFHLMTGDGERWRMHRLVREWARHIASAEDLLRARRRFIEGCAEYSRRIDLAEGFRIYAADGAQLEQAVREAEEVLGASDSRVSLLFDRVATALQSAVKNLGEDHPSVARSRSNLALVLQDLGELRRAKELIERAVALRRFNLAVLRRDKGDLAGARTLFAQALSSQERILGPDHPSTAHARVALADVLNSLGETATARAEAEPALRAVANQPVGSNFREHVERMAGKILRSE